MQVKTRSSRTTRIISCICIKGHDVQQRKQMSFVTEIYVRNIPDTCSTAQHDLRGRFNENSYPIQGLAFHGSVRVHFHRLSNTNRRVRDFQRFHLL